MWPATGRTLRLEAAQDARGRLAPGAVAPAPIARERSCVQQALGPVAAPFAFAATAAAALAVIATDGNKRRRSRLSPLTSIFARASGRVAAASSSTSRLDLEDSATLRYRSVEQLEEQLRIAVTVEDYTNAARLRDVIQDAKLDVEVAVLCANREFFHAFQTCDLDRMAQIWHEGDHTCCVHPSNYPIHGYTAVVESWDRVFRSGNVRDVQFERTSVQVRGNIGRVICSERINNHSNLVATNLFERTADGWKLWSHQAGMIDPMLQRRLEEEEERWGREH